MRTISALAGTALLGFVLGSAAEARPLGITSDEQAEAWIKKNVGDEWFVLTVEKGTIMSGRKRSLDSSDYPIVRMWMRLDFAKADEPLAYVFLNETDCTRKRSRWISGVTFTVDGKQKTDDAPGEWDYDIPDSIGWNVNQAICNIAEKEVAEAAQ